MSVELRRGNVCLERNDDKTRLIDQNRRNHKRSPKIYTQQIAITTGGTCALRRQRGLNPPQSASDLPRLFSLHPPPFLPPFSVCANTIYESHRVRGAS